MAAAFAMADCLTYFLVTPLGTMTTREGIQVTLYESAGDITWGKRAKELMGKYIAQPTIKNWDRLLRELKRMMVCVAKGLAAAHTVKPDGGVVSRGTWAG
jgi:hypothetical protein